MTYPVRLFLLGIFYLAMSQCLAYEARRPDWVIVDRDNRNGQFFIGVGNTYYRFGQNRREGASGKVSDLFPGLPSGIQAATWWPKLNKYYFFKNGKYYTANKIGGSVSGPFDGRPLGDFFTRPIDAATEVNEKVYFFASSRLYEYDGAKRLGFTMTSSLDLPNHVDAALSVGTRMYFFDGPRLWTVHVSGRKLNNAREFDINAVFRGKTFYFG